jgi:tetratricopeptide (TPR) repeat protein
MNLHPKSLDFRSRLSYGKSLAIVFFLTAFSTVSFAQTPDVRKAFRLIDIEQPSKGLAAMEQLVNANPTNSNYLYYLGLAQLKTGAKDKALATFEKGIATNEKDALNYAGKGHVKMLDKNAAEAKANLDKALQMSKSKDIQVLKAVADAYLTDSKYLLDAMNALNKAKTINATDPDLNVLLGDAQLMQNQQQGGEAVSSYERAAKADPKFAKPYYKVGVIYERAKANDIAISNFEKAIAADPEYAPAYKELGEIYYLQGNEGDAAKAVTNYEKYISISEKAEKDRYKLGFFYMLAKQPEKANAIFQEVLKNPNAPTIAVKYAAYSLIEQSKSEPKGGPKTQEAKRVMEQYFKRAKPEELEASDYNYLGKLQLATGEDSLAIENFNTSISMDTTLIEPAQLVAQTLFKRKKYDRAAEAYTRLIKMRKNPLVSEYFELGRSYFYNLDFVKADSIFTMVAEKTPNQTVGFVWAGKARRQIDSTGTQGLANPMYEAVIEKASSNPEKYKKDLIEAYEYLGSYYINIKPDVAKAKGYYQKILELDPSHKDAQNVLKAMKAG